MKKILMLTLAAFLSWSVRAAETSNAPASTGQPMAKPAPAGWTEDLPKAIAQAKAENKKVLIDFTGSDWCPSCQQLHTNILEKANFLSYAKSNFVLVIIDFPQFHQQADALAITNAALAKKFSIEGFPTVVILDGDGKEVHRVLGFVTPTVSGFIKEISGQQPPTKSSMFGPGILAVAALGGSATGWWLSRKRVTSHASRTSRVNT